MNCLMSAVTLVSRCSRPVVSPAFLVVVVVLASPGLADDAAGGGKPNVVLLMADDMGWGDVGFNGNGTIRTPHLDAMAGAGLVFDRFYAAAPVCSPTRGSVLTGRHPFRYGVRFANSGHMRDGERTLAELLKRRGYTTGMFGKWHLGVFTKMEKDSNRGPSEKHFAPPRLHGFDRVFATEAKTPTYDPLLKSPNARRTWWDPIEKPGEAEPYGTAYWNEKGGRVTENTRGDDSRVIMDRAIPFIRKAAEDDRPFLAVVWFHTPHLPVVAGPEQTAAYSEHGNHARHYFGCITAMDEQVGRLRETLRELGVANETLVAFCSDNGPEGGSEFPGSAGPLRGRKRSLHEGGVRVPSVIEYPPLTAGAGRTDFPAVTSDYLPTVLDLLDVGYPDDRPIDGVSLVSVLKGEKHRREKPIGFESRNQIAWTTQRYKLYSEDGGETWELYDLQADPRERHDIAGLRPDLVESLVRQVEAWRESVRRSGKGEDYSE